MPYVPDIPPADDRPRRPRFSMPADAWDCHAHVFGPGTTFPFAAGRAYTPPEQPWNSYRTMLDATGLSVGVLSQPSVYGNDNAALINALTQAAGRLRGVVVTDVLTLTDQGIEQWTRVGVRGVRLNLAHAGGLPVDRLASIGDRLADVGWHLETVLDRIDTLATLAPLLQRLRIPIVIEQMGSVRAPEAPTANGFRTLLALLGDGAVWCKLSHPYKISKCPPGYEDVSPYARALLAAAPHRLVWGSDWPHPRVAGAMPNDGALLDLLDDWADRDRRLIEQVLCANPARLYDRQSSIQEVST